MILIMTNKMTYGMTNERQTNDKQMTTNKNDKNDNNIYLSLFKKYKKKIEENPNKKIRIISEMKETSDYELLTLEEQDNIFYDLMNPNIRS